MSLDRFFNKEEQLAELTDRIRSCHGCELRILGQHCCPPYGDPCSRIMFVGEAPGEVENPDLRELPFVGNRSSDLMLDIIYGLWPKGYDDVFITNVVKCNPPGNRTPNEIEVEKCKRWLDIELHLLRPRVIVALGRTAANAFGIKDSLESARLRDYEFGGSKVFVVYHPAYILRFGPKAEEQYKASFRLFKRKVDEI